MRIKTHLVSIIAGLLLLSTLLTGVYATSAGDAIVGNITPEISSPTLTDVAAVNKNNAVIDVWTEYWAGCTIRDNNTLANLDTVIFKIWSSSTTDNGADNAANHYTFSYTQATDTYAEVGPDAGGSHLVLANCSDPADQTQASGIFRLAFKLAKMADRFASTTAWTINITAVDDASSVATVSTLTFGVNFYYEITYDDGTHGWSGLSPGDLNVLINSGGGSDGDIDITITANANFDVQARGSGALTSNGNTIALNNIVIHATTLGSAVPLTDTFADIGGLTAQSAGEDQAKAFKLWISIPNPQPAGTYTYTAYVQAVES